MTLDNNAVFKKVDGEFDESMLFQCERGCTTWIYTPQNPRRQLQTNFDFLGGTLTVSKEPNQLPLTSFQIGGEPCMDP